MLIRYEHRSFDAGCESWIKKYKKLQNLPHWHSEAELIVVEKGSGVITIDGIEYLAEPGSCAFIPAESIHTIHLEDDSLMYLAQFAAPCGQQTAGLSLEMPIFTDTCQVLDHMRLLYQEYKAAGPYKAVRVNAISALILTDLALHLTFRNSRTTSDPQERFHAMLDYANSHCESFTYEDAVRYMYMSEGYFSRYFKEHTGTTFTNYMNAIKVSRAIDLMRETPSISVTTLAIQSGFNTLRTFHRVFKNLTGYTCTQLPDTYTFPIRSFAQNGPGFDPTLDSIED